MRCIFFSLCVSLALVCPCHAGDKAKPNTLTAKELADGWLLLIDGQTTFGWQVDSRKANEAGKAAKVVDGVLDLGTLGALMMNFTTAFDSFEMRFDYQCDTDDARIELLAVGANRFISYFFPKQAAWTGCEVYVKNRKVTFVIPGTNEMTSAWPTPSIINWDQGPKSNLKLRNIKLRPLNTKPLFNGKDLTGWKEFPGKKSKFTVTDKGDINVKDGPGDLQTVGKYQNFVLQLECISLGEHLNSGIFFRCRDNEYQNGYEAQIRNQFTQQPSQKYIIEEYDPKTHKLVGKKEIMSTAVDYGTGAIYRRVPARKEMAKDNEWFAMTIVAHGNHFATWVNGVQVTDWTDNRPISDNARKGCKLEAGHISIQGHDPTTNLSFRNLRIAELPAMK